MFGWAPADISRLAKAVERGGRRGLHLEMVKGVKDEPNYPHPYWAALQHAAAGLDEKALQWLERAVDSRDDAILWVNVDPEWDHLRSDPRFVDVQRKIGLQRN